jgi:hypothetical protein
LTNDSRRLQNGSSRAVTFPGVPVFACTGRILNKGDAKSVGVVPIRHDLGFYYKILASIKEAQVHDSGLSVPENVAQPPYRNPVLCTDMKAKTTGHQNFILYLTLIILSIPWIIHLLNCLIIKWGG